MGTGAGFLPPPSLCHSVKEASLAWTQPRPHQALRAGGSALLRCWVWKPGSEVGGFAPGCVAGPEELSVGRVAVRKGVSLRSGDGGPSSSPLSEAPGARDPLEPHSTCCQMGAMTDPWVLPGVKVAVWDMPPAQLRVCVV